VAVQPKTRVAFGDYSPYGDPLSPAAIVQNKNFSSVS